MWGVVAGCGGVGCVCGVGTPRDCTRCGCSCGVSLFLVGCFADRVAVCPRDCLFVACGVLRRALLVCCCLCCLAAIVWCAFRECSRTACDAVCASVRLTATVIVAYSLLCNGRFQRFALFTGMPVVFVSVSYCHKGWWGESGVRGRWRLVARRTT